MWKPWKQGIGFVGLGVFLMSAGCASNPTGKQPTAPGQPSMTQAAPSQPPATTAYTPPSAQPVVPVSRAVAPTPLSVPDLIAPTASLQRLPAVRAGRSDPFASVPAEPIVRPATANRAVPLVPPAPPVVALPPNPQIATIPVPAAPTVVTVPATLPVTQSAARPATTPVATAPTPALPLAQAIQISGVVQVGGQTSIILQVPGEGTTRTASVGDALAGGQVVVKRIEVGERQEPRVILEQNGVEVVRSVGDGSTLVSAR